MKYVKVEWHHSFNDQPSVIYSEVDDSGWEVRKVERRDSPYGSQTNLYKLDGLIAAATPYAEEKLAEIAAKKKMREERLARKKPKLTLVKSE
jgi:hypothetical protein